jgi:hypothetical protein
MFSLAIALSGLREIGIHYDIHFGIQPVSYPSRADFDDVLYSLDFLAVTRILSSTSNSIPSRTRVKTGSPADLRC